MRARNIMYGRRRLRRNTPFLKNTDCRYGRKSVFSSKKDVLGFCLGLTAPLVTLALMIELNQVIGRLYFTYPLPELLLLFAFWFLVVLIVRLKCRSAAYGIPVGLLLIH